MKKSQPVYITLQQLRKIGACGNAQIVFRRLFGERMELSIANVKRLDRVTGNIGGWSLFLVERLMSVDLGERVLDLSNKPWRHNPLYRALYRMGAYCQYMGHPLV